ncbi:ribonuclease H-like domain-containing protein [Tanacetum coccineum]
MSLHGYCDGEYDDGSDVDNVTLISKLDGTENYQVWSCAMLLVLEGKNKTGFIDGSCRRSNTDEVLGRQWDRVNAVVLGWILNSISEELFLGQIFSKRAKHVWDELKETYDKVDGSVTFSLCTCHVADDFKKHNQLMKLMQFLMGLDDTYVQIKSSILSRETLPDVRSAYAIISSKESHRIAIGSMSGTSQRSQTFAFNVNDPNRGNFQKSQTSTSFSRPSNNNKPNDNGSRRTAGGSTLVCENCGFNGHTIDNCFKIIRYPADFGKRKVGSNLKGKNVSNNVVGSSSFNGFSDEQMATLISLIKENYINGKGVHSNMAGTYMNSSTVFNKNFKKYFCSNSSLHSKLVSKGLITDPGANQHITYTDKNLINVIYTSYLKSKVNHTNGTEAFITRIRNMPLTDYSTLYDVLVVSEYCVSLMSVHKVAIDSKLVIAFDEMHCYVMNQDLRKGEIVGTGKQIGGLYYFDGNQAKQAIEHFPLSDHVSTELGKLVHLDLWEPYKGGIPLNMWYECVLTATYLINRLPTSVQNGKSPYDLVYNKPSSLKHLRYFGCLAYATILNSHDKFGSRDVKFFEDIFPFKQNNSTGIDKSVQDVNHLNFFNSNTLDDLPEIPNDEERRNPNHIRHGNLPSHSSSTSAFLNKNDAGHSQDADASASENESFAADEDNNSSSEGNVLHDQSQDNGSQDNNVKYGLEKYVNYSYLSKGNYCFATMLNKGVEPKTYLEASQHTHWVDVMNAEMDALNRNNAWEIVDLPVRRNAISSK